MKDEYYHVILGISYKKVAVTTAFFVELNLILSVHCKSLLDPALVGM